jgi:carbamoyl-phosphate synthase small subunit
MVSTKAYVYTANGIMLDGFGFGSGKKAIGELVFTTAMTGYPESLTDPSYKGQILVFTHPLVGNYGVPRKSIKKGTNFTDNFESDHIQAEGVIVSEFTKGLKWNSAMTFNSWLKLNAKPGIQGIDTRMLTLMLRDKGTTIGIISNKEKDKSLHGFSEETDNLQDK